MSTELNAKLKKQSFAFDYLLPFYVNQMDSIQGDDNYKKQITQRMAEMVIFPYRTSNGIKYGKLSETGIKWYFCKDGKNANAVSTQSYRIIESSKFPKAIFQKVQFCFTQYNYLHEFSNKVVLDDMIAEMSKETGYTNTWWKYAIDAFKLWDKKGDLGTQIKGATRNINDSYFLFDDQYCEPEFRALLEKNHIYIDIRQTQGFKRYMSANVGDKDNDKLEFLTYLGIPSSFIKKEEWNDEKIDSRLIDFFINTGKLQFPVSPFNHLAYEQCRLSEYVFKVLYKENFSCARKLFGDDQSGKGIAVLNINDAYMSRCHSLFYLNNYDVIKNDLKQDGLNMLLVKPDRYEHDLLVYLADDVEDISDYDDCVFTGLSVKKLHFYKWAWQFTNNKNLLENILKYFNQLKKLDISYQNFALSVLDQACGVVYNEQGEYVFQATTIKLNNLPVFNMHIDSYYIIKHYHTFNALYETEGCDVSLTIDDAHNIGILPKLEDIKKRILDAVNNIVPGEVNAIKNDNFWNRITLLDHSLSTMNTYGIYVQIHQKDSKRNINRIMVMLVRHENRESYLAAIGSYLHDKYGIILNNIIIDWEKNYESLIDYVNYFISYKDAAFKTNDDVSFCVSDMDDIPTLMEEIQKWEWLKDERDRILRNSVSEDDFDKYDKFLDAKYHGRCQLCGNRTVSGPDSAHFWTYRILKKKDNSLSNMYSNIFCLCPTCHGELSYGYKGRDMTSIKMKAKEYVKQLEMCLEEDLDDTDTTGSIISEFSDQVNNYGEFHKPIVCDVVVNGNPFKMKFSWEHFMCLAFLLKQAE